MITLRTPKLRTICAATVAALVLFAASYTPAHSQSQPPCAKAAKLRASLTQTYAEVPVAAGVGDTGVLVEVFASREGSFTIVVTHPTGISCLLATGRDFMTMLDRLKLANADPA